MAEYAEIEQREVWDFLLNLAKNLTGQNYTASQKEGVIRSGIEARIRATRSLSVVEYLEALETQPDELGHFLSAVTIHTTNWFRELPHFLKLEQSLKKWFKDNPNGVFKLLVAACSTGQEAYSYALVLEKFRLANVGFKFEISAFDVDPVSVQFAQRGVYPKPLGGFGVMERYKSFILIGKRKMEGQFTFDPALIKTIKFFTHNLLKAEELKGQKFDWVSCRNVLIYFSTADIKKITRNLVSLLRSPTGILCLGHSDVVDSTAIGLKSIGSSLYAFESSGEGKPISVETPQDLMMKKALIVDDSAVVRASLKKIITQAGFQTFEAGNAAEADLAIKDKVFDFVSLDLQMPGEDGITWARRVRREGFQAPIVLVSDSTVQDAPQILDVLGREIQDFLDKKTVGSSPELLGQKAQALCRIRIELEGAGSLKLPNNNEFPFSSLSDVSLVLVGASTGGTQALTALLRNMPSSFPPVVVVQHITTQFSEAFSKRLASTMNFVLGTFRAGESLKRGHLYMSSGDFHVGVKFQGDKQTLIVSEHPPIAGHRPSVDFLFESVADSRSVSLKKVLAVLLTGMGGDGSRGLLSLRKKGALTVCQDEASSIVFGMPKEAIKLGAAQYVGNIEDIKKDIFQKIDYTKAA